jgi:hypothetical protein
MERRMNVSQIRAQSAFKKQDKLKVSYEEITSYFTTLEKSLRDKILDVTETSFVEWDSMSRLEQEELLQDSMTSVFSADESFYPAMYDAIEDYYELLTGLGPGISDVVASFIPAMENYTVIFSTHMAMMDDAWVVKGEYVDMSKEILYDLFKNLIQWLEGEVEIGPKVAERATQRNRWIVAFQQVDAVELGNKGDGWRKKFNLMTTYQSQNGVTRGTAFNHFSKWASSMFDTAKDGKVVYLRLKEELNND